MSTQKCQTHRSKSSSKNSSLIGYNQVIEDKSDDCKDDRTIKYVVREAKNNIFLFGNIKQKFTYENICTLNKMITSSQESTG